MSYVDPNTESRIPLLMSLDIYVPRDERFGHLKQSDFLGYGLKSITQFLLPTLTDLSSTISNEFKSFEDVLQIYEGGFKLPEGPLLENLFNNVPSELFKQILPRDDEGFFKYPMPDIIKGIPSYLFHHPKSEVEFVYMTSVKMWWQRTRLHGGMMKSLLEKW